MKNKFQSDKMTAYFRIEWKVLLVVTITGIIYNIGLLATPFFEGKLTGCLYAILAGTGTFHHMLVLVGVYLFTILFVQTCRFIKRNYVRKFANNTNRRMKQILYHHLILQSHLQLSEEGIGNILTKAIADVDDCSEGMRKFTTEIFDTGIALIAYVSMLAFYDWKLTILCLLFTPVSYFMAEKMKRVVQKTGAYAKKVAGRLNEETLDRATNALTYRVYGREENRKENYETILGQYEKASVKASLPIAALPPLYKSISLVGIFFILYFGGKNVLHETTTPWDIAIFTTYISCFMKLADKSSKAAKLFNAVHKAQVSWQRIQPYMIQEKDITKQPLIIHSLSVQHLSFHYPLAPYLFKDVSFTASSGQWIGITGHVACGKSTLGKVFLCEYPYEGSILLDTVELSDAISSYLCTTYLGHDPQVFDDTIVNNIALGDPIDVQPYLKMVCLDQEVSHMEEGIHTKVGNDGSRLSGGQAQRLALARTLAHAGSILILDDPFSALDTETEKKIIANLKTFTRDKIVLLISHRLYAFPSLSQVLYMENGHVYTGTHEQLLKTQKGYASIYQSHREISHENK